MDTRIELQKGDRLSFPGLECTIDHSVGRGSNVIAYIGHYRDHQNPALSHRILIRELFPFDRSGGISRDRGGDIHIEEDARPLFEMNRRSFLRANEVHLRLLEKFPAEIDLNIDTLSYHNTLYSLAGYSGGRNLYEELAGARWKDRGGQGTELLLHTVRILKGALDVLQAFHQSGYLHLDISPDNILLIGEGEKERVTLIDYNSVHTIDEIQAADSFYYSVKEGFTAPEVRMGRITQIREWTDLYSMTAVLYLCLTGQKLTSSQMAGITPVTIDSSNTSYPDHCPETVLAQLRRILRKGLAVTPRGRYQKVSQMRADLVELEDRILGRGITRWALWEAGLSRVRRTMKENPALAYLQDENRIYPLYAAADNGEKFLLTKAGSGRETSLLKEAVTGRERILPTGDRRTIPPAEALLSREAAADRGSKIQSSDETGFCSPSTDLRAPLLLLGGGGTGKTTALLRIACGQKGSYAPSSAIAYYISLYGYRDRDQNYICDRLLESLRFKPHTDSMESARRELLQLLDKPVREGVRGEIILLLDGLNEASGDIEPLIGEISRLSALAGVRIITTSRSDPGVFFFRKLTLCRLEEEQVRRILSEEGILPPENMEVFDLLTFPMLLAMYIKTVHGRDRQIRPGSRDQLLKEYFAAILEKEKKNLPEDHPSITGCNAAVRYLLPEIARLAAGEGRALSGRELRPLVENCYRELSGRAITSVYPDWIGHTADLRAGAGTADEWYGIAVLEILWKRLGLLVRDEEGNFRIPHQMIEEYLADQSGQFHRVFDIEKRREKTWRGILLMGAGLIALSLIAAYTAFMNAQLSDKQRQIIEKDTVNLIRLSETALEQGNRQEAVEAALQALPSESLDRPVTTEAEHALASSLLAYRSPEFRVTCSIDLPADPFRTAVSESGQYLLAADKYGGLRCYSGKTGEELWSEPAGGGTSLYVLEKADGVLSIGSNQLTMFSLQDGSVRWSRSCGAPDHPSYSYGFRNQQIRNEELLLLEENGNDWIFRSLDCRNGEEITPAVTFTSDWDSGSWSYLESGRFIQTSDDRTYFINFRNIYEGNEVCLDWINTSTGRCDKSVPVPVGENDEFECSLAHLNMKSLAPNRKSSEKGGLFVCIAQPLFQKNERLLTGFVEDGSNRFTYFDRHETDLSDLPAYGAEPRMTVPYLDELPDGTIVILYGKELITMGRKGENTTYYGLPGSSGTAYAKNRDFYTANVVYCRLEKDPLRLFILYEDGSSETYRFSGGMDDAERNREIILSIPDMDNKASVIGLYSRKMKGSRLTGTRIRMASGTGIYGPYALEETAFTPDEYASAFCLVPFTDSRKILVVEYAGDQNGRALSDPAFDAEMFRGIDGDTTGCNLFVFPGQDILAAVNHYTETVDGKGPTTYVGGSLSDIGDMSLLRSFLFSYSGEFSDFRGVSEDGVTLYFESFAYDLNTGRITKQRTENPEPVAPESCSAQDDSLTDDVRAIEGHETPAGLSDESLEESITCFSKKHKWLAVADSDNLLRIYDLVKEEMIQECSKDVFREEIQHMEFIMKDRSLAVWERNGVSVFDTSSGERVFYRETGPDFTLDDSLSLQVFEDEENLYFTGKTGFCLDTEEWKIRADIPYLAKVTEDWIITQEADTLTRYPKYTLQDMIQAGSSY